MAKLKEYNIPLKDISKEGNIFEFRLSKSFFSKLEDAEIEDGDIEVVVKLTQKALFFNLQFEMEGSVELICDRCLDTMDYHFTLNENLDVKLGESYSEEENFIVVPQSERIINIAWLMYELIALNIPIQHIHDDGECNTEMTEQLAKHSAIHTNDNSTDEALNDNKEFRNDPRWDRLKDIIENN